MKKNNAKLIKVKESKLTEKAEIFILNANKTYAEFTPKQREAEAAHETHEKINKQNNEINKKPDFIEDELKIFEIVLETIGDSKTHGVSNIIKAKSYILKFIWLVCLLASAGYCMYELVMAVMAYLQYGVILSTTPIYEAPTVFPAVDICNQVPFDSVVTSAYVTNITNQYNLTLSSFANVKDYTDSVSSLVQAELAKKSMAGSFNSFESGYNLDDMLISCFYEGTRCNTSSFYYYNDITYGNCFSFNLGKINNAGYGSTTTQNSLLKSSFPGADNGLQLELYVGSPHNQQLSYGTGIRVTIHNQSIITYPKNNGITVPTGMQSDIQVSRTFISHLNQPFSNCLTDPVDYTQNSILQTLKNNYSIGTNVYEQSFCLKVCLQQYIINQCGCYDLTFPMAMPGNLRACYEQIDLTCITNSYLTYLNNNQDTFCYAQCPLECNEIQISLSTSYSNYPSLWYGTLMMNNSAFVNMVQQTAPANTTIDYSFIQQNTLLLNVFYNTMGYTYIEESPAMTIDALIAAFGGNVGLFLGVTILSLVEFVEIIFYMIYYNVVKFLFKK